jgi:hypothetical protein
VERIACAGAALDFRVGVQDSREGPWEVIAPRKLMPGRGRQSSPGRSEPPAQCESKLYRNVGLQDEPGRSNMETVGKAEAGSGGDQPAEE